MLKNSWLSETLGYCLRFWNSRVEEIYEIVTMSPDEFRGGAIWDLIMTIHSALLGTGYALVVLFFLIGFVKTASTFSDFKRPEHVFKTFIRFALAKALVEYAMEILLAIFSVARGITEVLLSSASLGEFGELTLPAELEEAIEECTLLTSIPLWLISAVGIAAVFFISLYLMLIVYGRFFRIYLYTAIAPVPLSSFAGDGTQRMALNYLRSYASVCLEGACIVLSLIIFSAFASTAPLLPDTESPAVMLLSYFAEIIFNMLILIGTIKASGQIVHELFI